MSACRLQPREVSAQLPYAELIGTQYRVAIDDLYAYGVYESLDLPRVVAYIDLRPGGEIGGIELAFRERVRRGAKIEIVSAWETSYVPFEKRVHYVVTLAESGLSLPDVPVRLVLLGQRNKGPGITLNPETYIRMSAP